MKKFMHGNKECFWFPIVTSEGVATFGAPKKWEGMIKGSLETDESTTPIYADDNTYAVISGAKTRKFTLTTYQITEEYTAANLGYVLQTNGGLTDSGKKASHGICWITREVDGDTNKEVPVLHYLYNVVAGEPKIESETDSDEVTAAELEIEYTCASSSIALDEDGNPVQYFTLKRTEENATLFDTYASKVIKPTDVAA